MANQFAMDMRSHGSPQGRAIDMRTPRRESFRECYVLRMATQDDVDDDEDLELGQWLLSKVRLPKSAEIEYQATVPHVCPEAEA